jgi:hypothetical protein
MDRRKFLLLSAVAVAGLTFAPAIKPAFAADGYNNSRQNLGCIRT